MITGYSFFKRISSVFSNSQFIPLYAVPLSVSGSFLSCSSNNAPCPQHRKPHWQVVFIWPLVFKDRDILSYIRAESGNTSTAKSPGHQDHSGTEATVPIRDHLDSIPSGHICVSLGQLPPLSLLTKLLYYDLHVSQKVYLQPPPSSMAPQHANRSQLAHVAFSTQVAGHRMELADSLANYSQVSTSCPVTVRQGGWVMWPGI